MPLSGGTAGAHDDAMHQGSAKRDDVSGVVGVDASGHMLGVAHRIYLPIGGSNQVSIWDRTNIERIVRWIRNGANDYEGRITVANVEQKIQLASDKDVVNGIAGLDAGASIIMSATPTRGRQALADADTTRTGAELAATFPHYMTPTAARVFTLPTVANLWAAIPGAKANTVMMFSVISLAAHNITVNTNTGWFLYGNMAVNNASGLFLIQFDSAATAFCFRVG